MFSGSLAEAVSRSIRRDLTVQLRDYGKPFPNWALPVLQALSEASGDPLHPSVLAAIGPPIGRIESTNWVTVRAAAEASGRSERQIRRLAEAGRVRADRVGERVWRIDLESLKNVIDRRNH